jgi:hypothetical protein
LPERSVGTSLWRPKIFYYDQNTIPFTVISHLLLAYFLWYLFSSVFVPAKRARPLFTWTAVSMTAYAQPLKVRWDRKDEDQTPRLQFTRGWTQQRLHDHHQKTRALKNKKTETASLFILPNISLLFFPNPIRKNKYRNWKLTMPSQSFAVQHTLSPILSTSPQQDLGLHSSCDDGRRQQQRPRTELSSCRESYGLFKRCSMAGKTEGYSCSDAVASYMRCAFDDCQ